VKVVEILVQSLGYVVPALVVYFLMRQFLRGHMVTEQMKVRAAQTGESKALRLQAYERLILLCERLKLENLMLRLNANEMDATQLKNALLISIQKEFEHNLTQQIYVSGQLWQMLNLLKENLMTTVTGAYIKSGKDKAAFESILLETSNTIDATITQKVREGIRKEVELYFS